MVKKPQKEDASWSDDEEYIRWQTKAKQDSIYRQKRKANQNRRIQNWSEDGVHLTPGTKVEFLRKIFMLLSCQILAGTFYISYTIRYGSIDNLYTYISKNSTNCQINFSLQAISMAFFYCYSEKPLFAQLRYIFFAVFTSCIGSALDIILRHYFTPKEILIISIQANSVIHAMALYCVIVKYEWLRYGCFKCGYLSGMLAMILITMHSKDL